MEWTATLTCLIYLTLRWPSHTQTKPLKVFIRGFSGRNLPPGGWTHWFNVDHPGGAGDYETVDNVVRMYGRGCLGLPCRRPLAIKVSSVYGLRPSEEGNRVNVDPRRGLTCNKGHQHNHMCADYRVRFYCQNLHIKCRNSRYYPHHKRNYLLSLGLNNTTTGSPSNTADYNQTISDSTATGKLDEKSEHHNDVRKNQSLHKWKWRKGSYRTV